MITKPDFNWEENYKHSLDTAKMWYRHIPEENVKEILRRIFPELAENEGEKIRKELVDLLRNLAAQHFPLIPDIKRLDEWIAWLENQEYTFEIKEGHWYKCVTDYMLNNSDLMFKNDRLYYCRKDWRLIGEIDERNVKDIGVKGYKSFFRPATSQEIEDWLEKKSERKPVVIIPKFRIGDEIKTTNEEPLIITEIDEKGYWSEDLFICNFNEECIWDLVNEQKPVKWSEQQGKTALEAINEEKVDNVEQKLYLRFGDIPINEKSKIYRGEEEIGEENGVSVYPAFEVDGNIVLGLSLPITKTTLHTQQHLLEYDDRPCYLVKGNYIGNDADGQPLINNVHIVKKIDNYRVNEEKSDNVEPKFEVGDTMRTLKEANSNITSGLPVVISIDKEYYRCTNESIAIKDQDNYEYPPMNKNKQKFKVGDWIIENGLGKKPLKIVRFEKRDDGTLVWFNNSTGIYIDYLDNYYHLWSIDDAKAGDILITNANPFIYKGRLDPNHPDSPVAYCGIDNLGYFYYCKDDYYWDDAEVYPATEEQCELLFRKMKEAGYEWDAENKKLINKYFDMYSKIMDKIDNLQTSVKRNCLTIKDVEFLFSAVNDLLENKNKKI